jgi:hypothetical protein
MSDWLHKAAKRAPIAAPGRLGVRSCIARVWVEVCALSALSALWVEVCALSALSALWVEVCALSALSALWVEVCALSALCPLRIDFRTAGGVSLRGLYGRLDR